MSKQHLHELVSNLISYIHEKEANSSGELVAIYKKTIALLNEFDSSIDRNLSKQEREQLSQSLAIFEVKELDAYDKNDVSQKLAELNFEYGKYFEIIDPDILSLIESEQQ